MPSFNLKFIDSGRETPSTPTPHLACPVSTSLLYHSLGMVSLGLYPYIYLYSTILWEWFLSDCITIYLYFIILWEWSPSDCIPKYVYSIILWEWSLSEPNGDVDMLPDTFVAYKRLQIRNK